MAQGTLARYVEKSLMAGDDGVDVDAVAQALLGTVLPRILAYWRGLADDAPPHRDQFDPMNLGPLLSHIFLAERLPDGDYLYRVSGSFIVAGAGFDATMRRLSACDKMDGRDGVRRLYDLTLDSRGPRLDFMWVPWQGRDWQPVMRLLLPLCDADGTPRFLVGAADDWDRARDGNSDGGGDRAAPAPR